MSKRKGTHNEHRSKQLLEAEGYACTRAAGSLGMFDIVGIGPRNIVLVQCKTNRWPGRAEVEAIRRFQAPKNARKLLHRWNDRASVPDVRRVE